MTGQVNVSDEVLHHFRENGYRVSVINKRTDAGLLRAWHYALSLPRILWLLFCRPRPQLAYLTCSRSRGGFFRDALFIAACRARGVPAINHVHGSDLPELLESPRLGRMVRNLLNGLCANVMLSSGMAARCARAGLANMVVIRNFAAPAFFEVAATRGASAGPVRILYLSNVMQSKGIFDLIAACERLPAGTFELDIVGQVLEGDRVQERRTRATLEDLVRRLSFVKWHGPLYHAAKLRAYGAADIYCLPSHAEAAPLSLLEAMAAGLPCVVTAVGSVPEMVVHGEHALVVPPQQPAALADSLRELVASTALRRRLGDAAREHALRNFKLSRFRAELDVVVRKAVGPAEEA